MSGTTLALDAAEMPADAIEVGRVADAWGIKGWFKVLPHSASPEALFSSKRWFLLPPERGARHFSGPVLMRIKEAREHADTVVASAHDIPDRDTAQALKGSRIFVSRASFPSTVEGEYYWVDLIGLEVWNRESVLLGRVSDLMATGPQSVLVLQYQDGEHTRERLIPFVSAFIDQVDLPSRRITVDWQPDY